MPRARERHRPTTGYDPKKLKKKRARGGADDDERGRRRHKKQRRHRRVKKETRRASPSPSSCSSSSGRSSSPGPSSDDFSSSPEATPPPKKGAPLCLFLLCQGRTKLRGRGADKRKRQKNKLSVKVGAGIWMRFMRGRKTGTPTGAVIWGMYLPTAPGSTKKVQKTKSTLADLLEMAYVYLKEFPSRLKLLEDLEPNLELIKVRNVDVPFGLSEATVRPRPAPAPPNKIFFACCVGARQWCSFVTNHYPTFVSCLASFKKKNMATGCTAPRSSASPPTAPPPAAAAPAPAPPPPVAAPPPEAAPSPATALPYLVLPQAALPGPGVALPGVPRQFLNRFVNPGPFPGQLTGSLAFKSFIWERGQVSTRSICTRLERGRRRWRRPGAVLPFHLLLHRALLQLFRRLRRWRVQSRCQMRKRWLPTTR